LHDPKNRAQISDSFANLIGVLDIGAPFDSIKKSHWVSHPNAWATNIGAAGTTRRYYQGPLFARIGGEMVNPTIWPTETLPDILTMVAAGTKAISLIIPTNPLAGLAASLGELRNDGLPGVPGRDLYLSLLKRYQAGYKIGKIGSEYLNIVFGWAPTIKTRKISLSLFNDLQRSLRSMSEIPGAP